MSGSCELKTCWDDSPPIRVVGDTLKQHYQRAVEVCMTNEWNGARVCMARCSRNVGTTLRPFALWVTHWNSITKGPSRHVWPMIQIKDRVCMARCSKRVGKTLHPYEMWETHCNSITNAPSRYVWPMIQKGIGYVWLDVQDVLGLLSAYPRCGRHTETSLPKGSRGMHDQL